MATNIFEGLLQAEESSKKKYVNKSQCFTNIRELLKQNKDVKIGQIESESGLRAGYMSRLEKEDNTAEPSIEFIACAAKLLNVSIDTLLFANIADLTPHEQYITKFFDKLKSDTITDKLDWICETKHHLNSIDCDEDGYSRHSLFSYETFYEEDENGFPNQVSRVVFVSKAFGPHTYICDDCFKLRLKNGTTLYLMSIEKNIHKINDPYAKAIEAWLYVPRNGCNVLVSSKDKTKIASLVTELYNTVKEQMEHPKIVSSAQYAIDAFMKDDLADDPDDGELPF